MKDLGGVRRVSPRRQGADVVHVHEGGAPGHQPPAVVDGRDDVDVGLMDGGQVGIVQKEHIVLEDVLRREPLDDAFHRVAGADHVLSQGGAGGKDLPVRTVERRHVVTLLVVLTVRSTLQGVSPSRGSPGAACAGISKVTGSTPGNRVSMDSYLSAELAACLRYSLLTAPASRVTMMWSPGSNRRTGTSFPGAGAKPVRGLRRLHNLFEEDLRAP